MHAVNMDSVISALAGALWPAAAERATSEETGDAKYWALSGGDCPQLIQEVHRIIDNCFFGAPQQQVRLVLQILAYRLPTFLLAGRHCIKLQPPFVCSVPEMSAHDVHAMLQSWAHSRLPAIRKIYKALKSIIAAALLTHIDPQTGTNPFFEGINYTPGNKVVETGLGPEQPVAAIEEVLASATVDIAELVAKGFDVQAYLTKRGFATQKSDTNYVEQHNTIKASTAGSFSSSNGNIIHPAAAVELWYDAVVVGSGAGGGVSAALLSAAGLKVLVLEKAGWVRSRDMSWLESEAHDSMYERGGFVCTADGGMSILAGSTLGGGTKINWTASLKPPDHVRQEWASAPHNLPHLAPGSKLFDDALAAVCNRLGVSTGTVMSGPNANLLQGCHKLGLHAEELPRNCLSKKCSAYCNFGCRSGHKQSSDVCWLVDAVRAGAQVLTGVEGHRVLTQQQIDNKRMRVTGLAAVSRSKNPSSAASTLHQQTVLIHTPLVIASCGSLQTPALLLRSGITVGGNVGKHLRLHPAVGMVGLFQPTAEEAAAGTGAVNMFEGVAMGAFSRAAANWGDGGYGAMVSIPAVHPGVLAVVSPDSQPGGLKELMSQLRNVSSCVVFTRDSDSGRVTLDSEGRYIIHYWPCQQTLQHLLEGQALACRALVAAGALRILLPNSSHDWDVKFNPADSINVRQQQLEDFLSRVRRDGVVKYSVQLMSAHQMGSCRMGATPESSAVDPTGECWDVSGLYVADASLFPTASGVNPMITVYGLSYLVASGIAARWKQANKAANAAAVRGALDISFVKDQDC